MRHNRQISSTGYYHIVIRGVNKQNLFYNDADNNFFIYLLKKYSEKYNIKIQAYCLMDNHIHILICDLYKKISSYVQVVASVYARYFNKKYDRIGHLYQDRFASEVVNDDIYLKTVLRYILQNPVKAKMTKSLIYNWSSYSLYKEKKTFIDKTVINNFDDIKQFYSFLNAKNEDECLDIQLRKSEKNKYYIKKICKLLQTDIPIIKPDTPKNILLSQLKLLKKENISIRVISRITGIDKWLVEKA